MSDITKIEYQVRPVTRYVVTRYHQIDNGAGVETKGEFDSAEVAYDVGYALCKAEHERLGFEVGDERIVYPRPIVPASRSFSDGNLILGPCPVG